VGVATIAIRTSELRLFACGVHDSDFIHEHRVPVEIFEHIDMWHHRAVATTSISVSSAHKLKISSAKKYMTH